MSSERVRWGRRSGGNVGMAEPRGTAERLEPRLVLAAATTAAAPPVRFEASTLYDTGMDAQAVAAGDFNNDRFADLAVVSTGFSDRSKLTLMLGSRRGLVPQSPSVIVPGLGQGTLQVTDLDADSQADLVLVDGSSGLTVLRGRGDGTFAAGEPYAIPELSSEGAAAVGDFNADGRPDVAVARGFFGGLVVLLNRGDGTLADPVNYLVGERLEFGSVNHLAAGDFDGDGRLDLAAGGGPPRNDADEPTGSGLRLLFGNGDGTFGPAVPGPVGLGVSGLTAADLDADGRDDLIAATGEPPVTYFPGTAARTLAAGTAPDLGAVPGVVTTADLNRDGRPDLITVAGDGTVLGVAVSERRGGLRAPAVYAAGLDGGLGNASVVAAGDFDRDGRTDVAIADGVVRVLTGDRKGQLRSPAPSAAGDRPFAIRAGDFDGDKRPDLVVADRGRSDPVTGADVDPGFNVLRNLGRGRFAAPVRQVVTGGISPAFGGDPLAVGDFNGDGADDFLAGIADGQFLVRLGARRRGLADTGATLAPFADLALPSASAQVGDLNGDGRDDLAVTGFAAAGVEPPVVRVLLAGADGTFAAPATVAAAPFGECVGVGDFDADGNVDLLVSNGTSTAFLPGRGDGTFGPPAAPPVGRALGGAAIADFDRDGADDVTVSAAGAFLGPGQTAGGFRPALAATYPGLLSVPDAAAAADFNRDRIPDLVTASDDRAGRVLLGLGDGTFAPPAVAYVGGAVAADDFDRDGRADLAVLGTSDNTVRILLNRTDKARAVKRPRGQPTALDGTFAGTGVAEAVVQGSRADAAAAVVAQPNGKLLVAGGTADNDRVDFAIARLNADGTLDPTFGDGGRAITPTGGDAFAALAVTSLAIQPDGKVLAAGRTDDRYLLVRYLSDGRLDSAFADGGTAALPVTVAPRNELSTGPAVAVAADGRIVLAVGQTAENESGVFEGSRLTVVRYDDAGQLDPAFGTGGVRVRTLTGEQTSSRVNTAPPGLVVGPDGGILVVDALILSRFTAAGEPDLAFGGGDGRVGAGYDSSFAPGPERIALLPDGKILVARSGPAPGQDPTTTFDYRRDLWVQRYLPTGAADPTFGTGGRAVVDVDGREEVVGMFVGPGGEVVVAVGPGSFVAERGTTLVRLTAGGDREAGFGGTLDAPSAEVRALAARAAGGFVAVGTQPAPAAPAVVGSAADFVVTALAADGSRDADFGDAGAGGRVTIDLVAEVDASAAAVVTQPDGKVLAAGTAGPTRRLTVARFNPDGTPDASFGTGGQVSADLGGQLTVRQVAAQLDGKVLVVGSVLLADATPEDARTGFVVARFNPDGTPDAAFGPAGRTVTEFAEAFATAAAATVLPDGRILVIGTSNAGGLTDFTIARYLPDGSPDPAFGTAGRTTTDFGPLFPDTNVVPGDRADALAVLPDGRFVVSGTVGEDGQSDVTRSAVVARYNADGTLDETFGTGGRAAARFDRANNEFAPDTSGLAVLPDGRVVIASTSAGTVALAAFGADGTRDPAFAADGSAVPGTPLAVFPLPAGGFLTVSAADDAAGRRVAVLARFRADGSLDPAFGVGGRIPTRLTNPGGAALGPDGQLLLAGSIDGRLTVVRYAVRA